jgi:hypothetical protein
MSNKINFPDGELMRYGSAQVDGEIVWFFRTCPDLEGAEEPYLHIPIIV